MTEQYLFFCRHGYRDDHDVEFKGNGGLTTYGIAQAKLLGKELKKYNIDYMVSSPYKRTLITAEIIAASINISYDVDPLYSEWLNKEWHNKQPQIEDEITISKKYPRAVFCSNDLRVVNSFPEDYKSLNARCKMAANKIQKDSRNVLIITHGIIISNISSILTKLKPSTFPSDICSLTVLHKIENNNWSIVLNNGLNHMQKYKI